MRNVITILSALICIIGCSSSKEESLKEKQRNIEIAQIQSEQYVIQQISFNGIILGEKAPKYILDHIKQTGGISFGNMNFGYFLGIFNKQTPKYTKYYYRERNNFDSHFWSIGIITDDKKRVLYIKANLSPSANFNTIKQKIFSTYGSDAFQNKTIAGLSPRLGRITKYNDTYVLSHGSNTITPDIEEYVLIAFADKESWVNHWINSKMNLWVNLSEGKGIINPALHNITFNKRYIEYTTKEYELAKQEYLKQRKLELDL